MLGTEMHRRRKTQGEVLMQAHLRKDTHGETRIPLVCICDDKEVMSISLFVDKGLWSYILKLDVLQVGTNQYTEVQGTQIDIRLMLYLTLLGMSAKDAQCQQHDDDNQSSIHNINNAGKGWFIISTTYKLLKYLTKIRYNSKNIPTFASHKVSILVFILNLKGLWHT